MVRHAVHRFFHQHSLWAATPAHGVGLTSLADANKGHTLLKKRWAA